MRRRSIVFISTALGLMLMVAPAVGQWSPRETGPAGYEGSTLMETPSGGVDPNQPPIYYPYWSNYLDKMQQEGGYYSVTGNYPGSAPVTSYYPSSQYSGATSPQTGPGQSNIYYNPSEYYSNQGAAAYQTPQAQAYQVPQVQTYQAPGGGGQAVTGGQQGTPATGKKRRLSAKQRRSAAGPTAGCLPAEPISAVPTSRPSSLCPAASLSTATAGLSTTAGLSAAAASRISSSATSLSPASRISPAAGLSTTARRVSCGPGRLLSTAGLRAAASTAGCATSGGRCARTYELGPDGAGCPAEGL